MVDHVVVCALCLESRHHPMVVGRDGATCPAPCRDVCPECVSTLATMERRAAGRVTGALLVEAWRAGWAALPTCAEAAHALVRAARAYPSAAA